MRENDVVAIAEHWLHENRLSLLGEISTDSSYCGRSSRFSMAENYGAKRGQGGVALLWKNSLMGVTNISDIIHDRICGIRVPTHTGQILNIFSVYMPAQGCGEDLEPCLDDLAEVISSRDQNDINVVCGDFNADIGREGGPRSNKSPTPRGKTLIKLINEFGFSAINLGNKATGPVCTYFGPTGRTTIDYFLTPQELDDKVIKCKVLRDEVLNTSDHRPIQLELAVDKIVNRNKRGKLPGQKRWDKLSMDEIRDKYTKILDNTSHGLLIELRTNQISKDRLDECINTLIELLKKAASNIPSSRFRYHLKPYWNERLSELKRAKIKSHKNWIKNGSPREAGNKFWVEYKADKKMFCKELKRLGKQYEDDQIMHAVNTAEVDRTQFWKLVKRARNGQGNKIAAIKDVSGRVVSDIDDILGVWKTHFEKLYTPKVSNDYDEEHYKHVNETVTRLDAELGDDGFLGEEFSEEEVKKAVGTLHKRKACGYDTISTEHLVYGGPQLISILTCIYNHIVRLEYVPVNLRRGLQIPLFKGKGTCCLDTDNYRGISLLTNFNKVYEVLLWKRIEKWWHENGVISELQGAGKKKQSCVHTALLLQESVATALEEGNKVFVTFLDVSKAYDTVWTNGLFFQLNEMGLKGKIWRLMYRAYIDFQCKIRIEDKTSDWFPMRCGIHQGGFLSLTKYVAFINSLLNTLEETKLCCTISKIPSTPTGYADDVATACISKLRTDKVLKIVHDFGCKWRFKFNAKKSAILVYGESKKEQANASKFREFKLGKEKVYEKLEYDHVGVKACTLTNDNSRVEEKIGKGRRVLNATSGLGIRKCGITMKTCNLIFWTVVVPTLTFGCEIWPITDKDVEKIQNFQRFAGRRVQRFPKRSPACTSFYGLGWLRIDTYIQVKKLIFLLTLISMEQGKRISMIFVERVKAYLNNRERGIANTYNSPIFELLNTSERFGLLQNVLKMIANQTPCIPKKKWSTMVWNRAWCLDDMYWNSVNTIRSKCDILRMTIGKTQYLTWWFMADNLPQLQGTCETMARLACHASLLKEDDYRLKGESHSQKICTECDLGIKETVYHIVMQCPSNEEARVQMYRELFNANPELYGQLTRRPEQNFNWLMGMQPENVETSAMIQMWVIAGVHISHMYHRQIRVRVGVG